MCLVSFLIYRYLLINYFFLKCYKFLLFLCCWFAFSNLSRKNPKNHAFTHINNCRKSFVVAVKFGFKQLGRWFSELVLVFFGIFVFVSWWSFNWNGKTQVAYVETSLQIPFFLLLGLISRCLAVIWTTFQFVLSNCINLFINCLINVHNFENALPFSFHFHPLSLPKRLVISS